MKPVFTKSYQLIPLQQRKSSSVIDITTAKKHTNHRIYTAVSINLF